MADELPISLAQAKEVAQWMVDNFDAKLDAAVAGTQFQKKHLCAIACQETAYKWLSWVHHELSPDEILARCVFDGSGDVPDTSRNVFPQNAAAFRARYGDEFTDMLIAEANKTRALQPGFGPKPWLYKGYGLFQYDLQYVEDDEDFFRQKQWYSIDSCLDRAMRELKRKYAATGELWSAIKAYNGSGPRAEQYKKNVQAFTPACAEITGEH